MLQKLQEFIKTVREVIELVEAIQAMKKNLGPQVVDECNKLKAVIQASSNPTDDALLPIIDKVIAFFS